MGNLDDLSLGKIRDIIDRNDNLGIIVRKNPQLDDMAAGLSLYLSLKNVGKNVSIVCSTEPLVEVSFLVGIDKVKTNFDTSKADMTVSFPYKEGEIEKISYTLEDGFLNILVKAGENGLSFEEKDIRYKRERGGQKAIFTIGISGLSEISELVDMDSLKNTKIVNIDNKVENQGYGDIVLVSRESSSISEQVAFVILSLGFKVDVDIAQNLLSGINVATDNFQDLNTSILAFEIAATLMKKGAIRTKSVAKKNAAVDDGAYSFFTPMGKKQSKSEKADQDSPPADWLAPKIYKGSTEI